MTSRRNSPGRRSGSSFSSPDADRNYGHGRSSGNQSEDYYGEEFESTQDAYYDDDESDVYENTGGMYNERRYYGDEEGSWENSGRNRGRYEDEDVEESSFDNEDNFSGRRRYDNENAGQWRKVGRGSYGNSGRSSFPDYRGQSRNSGNYEDRSSSYNQNRGGQSRNSGNMSQSRNSGSGHYSRGGFGSRSGENRGNYGGRFSRFDRNDMYGNSSGSRGRSDSWGGSRNSGGNRRSRYDE